MICNLQLILESKRILGRKLASCSVAEKLVMLDVLRDRTRTIRQAATRKRSPESPQPAPESAAVTKSS